MFIEKIKLFFAKRKIIQILVVLLIIGAALYLTIQIYYSHLTGISDTTKGIIGTLLGAVVGGCFTLAGTYSVSKNSQRAQNVIKRKNIIYKPLYDELKEIHSVILEENPFPYHIAFEKGDRTHPRYPEYTVWGRIQNDSRLFEVPVKLKKYMEELYRTIEEYQRCRKKAVDALDRIYKEESKRIYKKQIADQANVGDSLLQCVLSGKRPDDDYLTWSLGPNNVEGADELWESVRKYVISDRDLKNCIEAKAAWNEAEEDVLELLGLYIQYISKKYEG